MSESFAQDSSPASAATTLLDDAASADQARRYEDALKLYEQAAERSTSNDERGYIFYQMALIEEKRARPAQALEILRRQWEAVSTSAQVSELDLFVARLERQVSPVVVKSAAQVVDSGAGMRVSASDLERRNAMRGPWVTMGGGFLAAVAGGALILGSVQEEGAIDQLNQDCQMDPTLCQDIDLDRAARRADAKRYGGIAAAGLGVATLTGGIIWFVKRKRQLDAGKITRRGVELSPWSQKIAAHRYQGVGVSVRF